MDKVQSLYHVDLEFWARNQHEADLFVAALRAAAFHLLQPNGSGNVAIAVSDPGFDTATLR